MGTQRLFTLALLYIVREWVAGVLHRRLLPVARHAEGEADGILVHRFTSVTKTITGRTTDVTFHYVEAGVRARECVVFLHGFMDTWRVWRRQLAILAERYHVVAFDLKGAGESSMRYPAGLFPDVNEHGGDYTLEMQADELATALEQIGVTSFNLVTLDLGTIIGDILAGRYAKRVIRYVRCQQPLVGHFRSSIPQGRILRKRRGARLLTAMLEEAPGALLRILYGRTGWAVLDRRMRRAKEPMPDEVLRVAEQQAYYPFSHGPRAGKPGVFACAWAGLYQHNRDYMGYLFANIDAYRKYIFPVLLVQGIHDIAMPPSRFDGTTGMAFRTVRRPSWMRTAESEEVVLSRAFTADGRGLGDGYTPWGELIPDCSRPLEAREFFPNSPYVELKFLDAGHFLPVEAPEALDALLDEFLTVRSRPREQEAVWKMSMS
jgi:pimeloyl-ACP methyl ester carboxylesterase